MLRGDFHREEVRRCEDFSVQLQELLPAQASLASSWGRIEVVATYDVAHRDRVSGIPQIRQGALDAAITPGGILFGHADHQLFDLLRHTGSTKVTTVVASVELLSDQAVVPAQEHVGGGGRGHLLQACAAERVGQCRETAARSGAVGGHRVGL
jgi:hypothetical protein